MALRLAINGFGRIGRCVLRAWQESRYRHQIDIAAINEPAADIDAIAYLTRFDSTHGRFPGAVAVSGQALSIDGQEIPVFHGRRPADVPWQSLDVDILLEASGAYGTRPELTPFLTAGCRRVLLSNPGQTSEDVDRTIVFGINENDITGAESIISGASCTTNAIVPVLKILHREYHVEQALMTTLHSVMNDQPLIDGYHHADLRRTRSAMQSMIPVATGLARGVERLMPELAGCVQAKAIRMPVANVSAIDLVATLRTPTTVAAINTLLAEAARNSAGLLGYSDETHASIDFNHSRESAIVDAGQTRLPGQRLAGLLVWFDNEWGYANRLLDLADHWLTTVARQTTRR